MYCVAKVFYRAFSLQPLKGAFRTVLRLLLSPPASCFCFNVSLPTVVTGLRERPPGESHASNAMRHRLPIEMVRKNSSSEAPRQLRVAAKNSSFFSAELVPRGSSSRYKVTKTCSKDTHPDPPSGLSPAPPAEKTNNEKANRLDGSHCKQSLGPLEACTNCLLPVHC